MAKSSTTQKAETVTWTFEVSQVLIEWLAEHKYPYQDEVPVYNADGSRRHDEYGKPVSVPNTLDKAQWCRQKMWEEWRDGVRRLLQEQESRTVAETAREQAGRRMGEMFG